MRWQLDEGRAVTTTTLYKYYDQQGELIYIGIATRPGKRMGQHNDKPWFELVARSEFETYPSRDLAASAERDLVRRERPRFNIQHNRDNQGLRQADLYRSSTMRNTEAKPYSWRNLPMYGSPMRLRIACYLFGYGVAEATDKEVNVRLAVVATGVLAAIGWLAFAVVTQEPEQRPYLDVNYAPRHEAMEPWEIYNLGCGPGSTCTLGYPHPDTPIGYEPGP